MMQLGNIRWNASKIIVIEVQSGQVRQRPKGRA